MAKKNGNGKPGANSKKKNNSMHVPTILNKLSPEQIAVIAGILLNALEVESVLVDRDQKVEIVLSGSLRRKTKMDQILEQISDVTIGDFLDSFRNLS